MTSPHGLFRTDDLPAELRGLLEVEHVWEILARLDEFGARLEPRVHGRVHPSAVIEGPVYVAEGAEVGPHALLEGPVWVGEGAVVGHGAYLRAGAVLAPGARVGHSSEVKRSLMLPHARAPHFNYVGDSIVGRDANLGAGVKIANFKTFGSPISVAGMDTGLRKFGAAIGDEVSIGCNAVLTPGTIVGPRTIIYNGVMARGVIPADTIVKLRQGVEQAERRPTGAH